MTITIDIPAISELAAAIRYHADHPRYAVGIDLAKSESITPEQALLHQQLAKLAPAEGQAVETPADPQPAKRTRRTKAEMDAERKAIEETKGRRTDGPTPEPIEAVSALVDEANAAPFQWTLELLRDTFLAITPEDASQEAKDAANAKLTALKGIREAIAPEAQNLSTMDEKHYAEFAKQATAWYREQGLELKLPEGCEL